MKLYFFEFAFDFFKISQITKHDFLLRSTFVIEDFHRYSILVFANRFLTIFRAEGPSFRLHIYKETPLKNMHENFFCRLLLVKIANDEISPQQKHMLSILRNLHKVKKSF